MAKAVGKETKVRARAAATDMVKPFKQAVAEIHAIRPPLTQNPHAVRDTKEKVLEVAIGREVRAFRKKLGITVADLAQATSLSLGMLSKIENGITSPSLTTLQALSHALGVPVTAFFRRFEEERAAVFVKAGEGLEIERRGTRAGHQYNLLGHVDANTSGVVVEPYLITLSQNSDVFPTFQHLLLGVAHRMRVLRQRRAYGVDLGDRLPERFHAFGRSRFLTRLLALADDPGARHRPSLPTGLISPR